MDHKFDKYQQHSLVTQRKPMRLRCQCVRL